MTIGERIAQYRKARGMTQQQLADQIGAVKQTIGNYERGDREPTIAIIGKIAKVLGVSRAALYGVQDANDAFGVGERLTNYMLLNGDTAAKLGLTLGISIEDVQRMCAGDLDPTPAQRHIIAERYNVSEQQLFRELYEDHPSDDDDPWTLREELRRDPNRKALLKLARNGSAQDVRQAMALIDALRATNPDFYDGDDPA